MARHFPLWTVLLWVAVAGLIILALRGIPLYQVGEALGHLGAGQIMALLLANLGILWMMAARWRLVLRLLGARIPLTAIFAYRLAGLGVSYFTPGPQFGGEPLQAHLLVRKHNVVVTTAVSSVLLDRLVDLLVNFTFLFIGVCVVFMKGLVGDVPVGLGIGLPAVLALFPAAHVVALWRGRQPAGWLMMHMWRGLQRMGFQLPLLERIARAASESEGQIAMFLRGHPAGFVRVVLLAGLTWCAMIFEFWLALRFLGIPAGLVETIAAQTAARLAFLLPLPAGLGALEASQVLAMRMLGIDPALGIALSLVIRARDVFFGLLGLWVGGYAYRSFLFGLSDAKERSS